MKAIFKRWVHVAVLVVVVLSTSGQACRGNPRVVVTEFDRLVTSVAHSQGVDEFVVREAAGSLASTADDQLHLVQTWDRNLPTTPLPRLPVVIGDVVEDVGEQAVELLKDAACAAVFDIIRTGDVPSGALFVNEYLTPDLQELILPELSAVEDAFQDLYDEAVAGTLTYQDVRLTMMQLQYC